MSNIEEFSNPVDEGNQLEFQNPEKKLTKTTHTIMEELGVMAMQKNNNTIEFASLDKGQKDKILENVALNELNAYNYHIKKLESVEKIELLKLSNSVINQKTFRFLIIGLVIFVVLITLIILLIKDTYFITWLAFLAGNMGGIGISKITSRIFTPIDSKNPIQEV